MKQTKIVFALLFALAVLTACLLLFSLTTVAEIVDSGECGDTLTWTLDDEGTLRIEGDGAMWDWNGWSHFSPWYGRTDIQEVIIGNGVTSIGSYALAYSSLTNVTIPVSVAQIGESSFFECYSHTTFTVAAGNPAYSAEDGILYSADKATLLCCPAGKAGNAIISDCTTGIADMAFNLCTAITRITIPAGVINIHGQIFFGCTALTEFSVAEENPAYLAKDGILYSTDMTSLICCPAGKNGSITIPDSITNIGKSAFACCTFPSITIPTGVTVIYDGTFRGSSLTSITLHDGITTICSGAFRDCRSLLTITIPGSVTVIQNWAFNGCSSLTDIYCAASEKPEGWVDIWWNDGCNATVHWDWKNDETIMGDINGDKVLSIMDVTMLLQILAKTEPGDGNIALYDINNDKILSIMDVTKLLQMLASAT